MEIKELLKQIPEGVGYIEPKAIINVLLKWHYTEMTKIYEQVREFRKDDPLMELVKIEQEFANLLNQYKGTERLTNPVFDLKVGALTKKQKKLRAKAEDYNVLVLSDAESNLRHYCESLFRMIQNNQWPIKISEKDELVGTKMMELIVKYKD